jgi:hypothetical protein
MGVGGIAPAMRRDRHSATGVTTMAGLGKVPAVTRARPAAG